MRAIFSTLTAARAYIAQVDASHGYPNAATLTQTHDVPIRHPMGGKWSVIVDDQIPPSGATLVAELPADWTP